MLDQRWIHGGCAIYHTDEKKIKIAANPLFEIQAGA
jgi:hypothetical protein